MKRAWWFVALAVVITWLLLWRHSTEEHVTRARVDRQAASRDELVHAVSAARVAGPQLQVGELRLEGIALDDDDEPLAGARVVLDEVRETTTERDGSFVFAGVAAGPHVVAGTKDHAYGEASLDLDATTEPVKLSFATGPTVVMKVVDPDGAPIAGAKLAAMRHDATTGSDGTARLRGVEYDSTDVIVIAEGRERVVAKIATGDDPAAIIEHTVVLRAGGTLSGRVVDDAGRPVGDVRVEIEAKDGRGGDSATSDATGAWQLAAVGDGTYAVRAISDRFLPNETEIDVHGHAELVVRLARGDEIAGRVVDEAGAPIANARVITGSRDAMTDERGAFVLAGLVPDKYVLLAMTERGSSEPRELTLTSGARTTVELVVRPSTISGVVVDSQGIPVDEAKVIAHGPDPFGFGVAHTDAHGRFDLGGLQPGEYEVFAARTGWSQRANDKPVHVVTGATGVRLVAAELANIRGRVVLAGQPVEYFGFVLATELDDLRYAWPHPVRDVRGAFRQLHVEPGAWYVAVVGPSFTRRIVGPIEIEPGSEVDLGDLSVSPGSLVREHLRDYLADGDLTSDRP